MRINSSHGRAPSRAVIYISITLVMLIWAVNFLAGKVALRYIPALTLGALRIVVAAFFLLLLYPLIRRAKIFQDTGQSPVATLTWRDYPHFASLGFFGFVVNQICFTTGLSHTSVAHSSIIVGMGPVYTLILAVIFRLEQGTARKATGMAVSLAGVAILASGAEIAHRSPTLYGDALTVCGSLGFATWVVLGKRFAGRYNPLTSSLWSYLFASVMVLPLVARQVVAFGPLRSWLLLPWQAWASLFFMTFFSSTLAYLFYLWLLRFVEASEISAFSYLMPVSATALSIALLGEHGTWSELAGGSLALAGVYWVESGRRR